MKVLVTSTAGFIGSHVALRLLERGDEVVGFDNLSDYYDVNLKKVRLARFMDHPNYTHIEADLADRAVVEAAFATHKPQRVINLAAQAVPGARAADGDAAVAGGGVPDTEAVSELIERVGYRPKVSVIEGVEISPAGTGITVAMPVHD